MQLITDVFLDVFKKFSDNTAFIDNKTGLSTSFHDFKIQIFKLINILSKYSTGEHNKMVIYLRPHIMFHIIEFALFYSKNISVLCDYTYKYSEIEHIINVTDSDIIFTDNIKFIEEYSKNIGKPKKIFYIGANDNLSQYNNEFLSIYNLVELLDKESVDETIILKQINPEDIATILFSSGTTGNPKGVVYTYESISYSYLSHHKASLFKKKGCCLTILSCSHIAPKLCNWSVLAEGNCIIYSDFLTYQKDVLKYKPLYLECVPKLLLMHKDDYYKKLTSKSIYFQNLHNIFFEHSKKYVELKNKNKKHFIEYINMYFLKLCNHIYIKLFFKKILQDIGLTEKTNIIAFGAGLDIKIEIFYAVIGTKLLINYGLTEGGTLAYNNLKNTRLGSVGITNPYLSVIVCNPETDEKLPKNSIGLIKAKGPQIMQKYYNDEEATNKAFDDEGYLITGDMGYISDDNFVFLKGRYKNIIVLNNGENINPECIEELCNNSEFVSQVILFGQDMPFLTAVIVPNFEYIHNNFDGINPDDLKYKIIMDINNMVGQSEFFKWIHQIKDIVVADEPFTQENGLLTKKFSLNRPAIHAKYKTLIEDMYKDEK